MNATQEVKRLPAILQPPVLKIDTEAERRYGSRVSPNGRLERRLVWNLLHHLMLNGWQAYAILNEDTGHWMLCVTPEAFMELAFNYEEPLVRVRRMGQPGYRPHRIKLIDGNGIDMISDHTLRDTDNFGAVMDAFDSEAMA